MQQYMGVLLTEPRKSNAPRIDRDAYEQWRRSVVFDNLKGLRFGQSFCNHFDIEDALLFYSAIPTDQQDQYIREKYIK